MSALNQQLLRLEQEIAVKLGTLYVAHGDLHLQQYNNNGWIYVHTGTILTLVNKHRNASLSYDPSTLYQTPMKFVLLTSTGVEVVCQYETIMKLREIHCDTTR
jgi:hypothetical protein